MEFIGVLGGSFNPPHRGHIRLTKSVAKYFSKILVVPCGDRPDKAGLVPGLHRLEMTKIAFSSLGPKVEVSTSYSGDIEMRHGAMIPSYYLLTQLMRENPSANVKMIIGSDLVPNLPQWIQAERLLAECQFFVIPRSGFEIPKEYRDRDNFQVMPDDYQPSKESSTSVRKMIEEGADMEAILREATAEVVDYIRENGLYGEGSNRSVS